MVRPQPTEENVNAAGNALLQAPLDGAHPDGDHAAVRRLPSDVRDQRRYWRDLAETRIRGARIGSLDRPLRSDGADPLTLLDTLGACDELTGPLYAESVLSTAEILSRLR